jgi:hypothetical protein
MDGQCPRRGRGLRRLRLTVERLQPGSAVRGMGLGGHIAEQQYSAMNVRFGSKADIDWYTLMSAIPPKADIAGRQLDVCFGP